MSLHDAVPEAINHHKSHKKSGPTTLFPHRPPRINRAYAVTDVNTGQQLEYHQLLQLPDLKPIWERVFANELVRLAQGVHDIKGTDTIVIIPPSEIPKERTITYGRLVCDIRPQKAEQHRVRLTIGGERINYPGEKQPKIQISPHPSASGTALYRYQVHGTCAPTSKKSISTPCWTAPNTCNSPSPLYLNKSSTKTS
jgi:hypothetical protein